MSELNGTIYAYTDPLGRSYVGLTKRPPEFRRDEHIRKSKVANPPTKIARAMKLYGHENFVFEILHANITDDQLLNELEIKEIAKHDSYHNGYNCDKGGLHGFHFTQLWKDRKKIADMHEIQGLSATEIAKVFGVTQGMVCKLLHRLGIQPRTAGHYKKDKPSPNRSPYRCAAERNAPEIYRLCTQEFMRASKIAKMYQCNGTVINGILKSMGIDLRGKHPAWLYADEIACLYTQAEPMKPMNMTQIAEKYRCDQSVIRKILDDMGVEIRDGKNPVWKQKKEIARLYEEDLLSANLIAKKYECSVYLIRDILLFMGVTFRTYEEAQLLHLKRKDS